MKILAIETSCDETAISILDFKSKYKFEILSEIVLSQIDIHKEYGGVFPALAKREHLKNLFPVFFESLKKTKMLEKRKKNKKIESEKLKKIKKILERDPENLEKLIEFYEKYKKPVVKHISVTHGPGLEIALWTGFNFAKALSVLWDIDFVPVNHLEGHIFSALIDKKKVKKIKYPALGVLISGGHTELIHIKDELSYKIIGETLDDAIGEAYDKVARLIDIDYPGGPEISKFAEMFHVKHQKKLKMFHVKHKKHEFYAWFEKKFGFKLPRPMLNSGNFDFSFSGLKTAVLYLVKKQEKINKNFKEALAYEFENAVSDVLLKKVEKAVDKYKIKEIIVGGGVSANDRIRAEFLEKFEKKGLKIHFPDKKYTGDNATMIAVAGFYRYKNGDYKKNEKKVYSNLDLKYVCRKK